METKQRDERRRRRILERGQDRLNLITGRVQSIASTDSQSSFPDVAYDDDSYTSSRPQSPPLLVPDLDPMPHHPPDKSAEHIVASLATHDQAVESTQNGSYTPLTTEEPILRRRGTGTDISRPPSEPRPLPDPSSATWNQPNHTSLPEQLLASAINFLASIKSSQLNTAISATEQVRRVLSMTMSLIVLLSYFGFPVLGNKITRSIIVFRPLFLLLVINISLVALRLMAELEPRKKDAVKLSGSALNWAVEAGRALELGLMLQNVLGSLFMDVSLYALIIVCGFSVAAI